MDMCLPKPDIYQSTEAPKSHTNSWCPNFFQKNLSDVRSEINLVDVTSFLPVWSQKITDLKFTLSDVTSFLPVWSQRITDLKFTLSDVTSFLPVWSQRITNAHFKTCWINIHGNSNYVWKLDTHFEWRNTRHLPQHKIKIKHRVARPEFSYKSKESGTQNSIIQNQSQIYQIKMYQAWLFLKKKKK